jgi:hypothetical protein
MAYDEMLELQSLMLANPMVNQKDIWCYAWGEKYFAAKFYGHIHSHISMPKVYDWLWKSSCVMTSKVFAWLLIKDRLNTCDMLHRRHWNVAANSHCVLCPLRAHEDIVHLFFECNFSQRIWTYLQIDWRGNMSLQDIVATARLSFGNFFFMEVVIMAYKHIWLLRNAKIFGNETPTFTKWKCNFIHSISLLKYRIKAKHVDSLSEWISSLH